MDIPNELDVVLAILTIWLAEPKLVEWCAQAAERAPLAETYPHAVAELEKEAAIAPGSPYYKHCLGKRLLEQWKKAMRVCGDPGSAVSGQNRPADSQRPGPHRASPGEQGGRNRERRGEGEG